MAVNPVVVGGGISGLSAAYYLSKLGESPVLFEKEARFGGVIKTEIVDGCVVEAGPDGYLAAKPWARELIHELGLGPELIHSNDHLRLTYIVRNRQLIPMPDGLLLAIPTRLWPIWSTRLLSWRTKLRFLAEWFYRRRAITGDRSVREFLEAHYGPELVDFLADPLLAGVYGGSATRLSAEAVLPNFVEWERRHGSLTRAALRSLAQTRGSSKTALFESLRNGLETVVHALTRRLGQRGVLRHGEVEQLVAGTRGYRLRVDGQWLEAPAVILACPAWQAARILEPLDAELASLLGSIEYTSSVTAALIYREQDLPRPPKGFGFLVPATEGLRLIAATWVGVKFPHRVPDGYVVLRCFLGGSRDPAAVSLPEHEILELLQRELAELLGLTRPPRQFRIYRWPHSMAQYTVGHRQRVAAIEQRIQTKWPGLYLAGNAYSGVGVPDCVRLARLAAERAHAFLAHPQ